VISGVENSEESRVLWLRSRLKTTVIAAMQKLLQGSARA
jgi:hypothetical protein